MPGEQGSYDLIRTKDERSNSKADTFFIAPKGLGNEENQIQDLQTEAIDGDVTGSQRVETLAGSNLSISGNALTVASSAVYSDEKAQDAVGNNVDGTLAYDDAAPSFGVADGAIGTQQLNTPFTDLTTLHATPVTVGASDLRVQNGQGIEDTDGQTRFLVEDVSTTWIDDAGDDAITAVGSLGLNLEAYDGKPVEILDNQLGDTGVEYQTGPSSGTLFLRNATLDADGSDIVDAGTTVYDASTDTVGDGTTSADHQSVNTAQTQHRFPSGDTSSVTPLETFDKSGSGVSMFNIGTIYDLYKIEIFGLSSSPDEMTLTLDGQTTADYYQEDADGTSRTGRSNWLLGDVDNDPLIGSVLIYGDKVINPGGGESDMFPKIVGNIASGGPSGILSGELRVSTDTISSIEIVPTGSDVAYSADVYGKNFAE